MSPVEPHRTVRQSRNQTHIARWDPSRSREEPVSKKPQAVPTGVILIIGGTFKSNWVQFVHRNLGIFKVLGCNFLN